MSEPPTPRRELSKDDWIELDLPVGMTRSVPSVELRGHGKDRHGVLGPGGLIAAGPDPTPVPSQDDWDF